MGMFSGMVYFILFIYLFGLFVCFVYLFSFILFPTKYNANLLFVLEKSPELKRREEKRREEREREIEREKERRIKFYSCPFFMFLH